jgi:HupE / UreJ protein
VTPAALPQRRLWAGGLLLLLLIGASSLPAFAHPTGLDLSKLSRTAVVWEYVKLGFEHIIPKGFDHILFVLSLYLLEPRLKPVLLQATVFTVAHSITLGLASQGLIYAPPAIVEPLIALSILFVAVENMLVRKLSPWRLLIVFGFGLVHGLGFAGVLGDLGLPQKQFFSALLAFNGGVELGQVAVILLAWAVVGRWTADKSWYHARVVIPACSVIALVAGWWTVERLFLS